MKRRVSLIVLAFTMVVMVYLQFGREVELGSTTTTSFSNGSDLDMIVIANKLYIPNKKRFASEMIDKYIQNDFEAVDFCPEEQGYTNSLHITVYHNKLSMTRHKKAFEVDYIQKDGGIFQYDVSQSRHFTMKIR